MRDEERYECAYCGKLVNSLRRRPTGFLGGDGEPVDVCDRCFRALTGPLHGPPPPKRQKEGSKPVLPGFDDDRLVDPRKVMRP